MKSSPRRVAGREIIALDSCGQAPLPLQLLPMLAAADVLVAQDAVQQDAECLRDEVARRVHALERQLGMRNPSANGPAALMWRGLWRHADTRSVLRETSRVGAPHPHHTHRQRADASSTPTAAIGLVSVER